jgi:hypothetical protein
METRYDWVSSRKRCRAEVLDASAPHLLPAPAAASRGATAPTHLRCAKVPWEPLPSSLSEVASADSRPLCCCMSRMEVPRRGEAGSSAGEARFTLTLRPPAGCLGGLQDRKATEAEAGSRLSAKAGRGARWLLLRHPTALTANCASKACPSVYPPQGSPPCPAALPHAPGLGSRLLWRR